MPPKSKSRKVAGPSNSERLLRILALLALVAVFALSGLGIARQNQNANASISPTPGVSSPTPNTFPTVPPGGTILTLDRTYFQPSALFSVPHIVGWDLPPDGEERVDPSQGSTISRAGATFINGPALSVVHVFAERDLTRKAKTLADLDAYYDKKNLDAAWSNFTGGYKETGRRTDGDKFIINFELYLNGNTYLGRQVSQFDGDWLKVSRLVAPNNNPALMDALQTVIWSAFTIYPAEASPPLAWPAIADPVMGYAIRYRPEWTSIAGGAGVPNIVSGPLRTATITMTTRAEPGKVVKADADVRAWVTSLTASATVQTVQPTTINDVNGFNVSFNDPDADGNPRSAVATLLNGANGTLYTATFISTAHGVDLLSSDPTVPPELAQLRATFIIIPTSQLVPTLTPTVTPTPTVTYTPSITPTASNTVPVTPSATPSTTPTLTVTVATTVAPTAIPTTQAATVAPTTLVPPTAVSTTQLPTVLPTTAQTTQAPTNSPPGTPNTPVF
ncbi:MAG: hypothetical protein ACYDBJ_25060 [Aggregatilineales bacterium]